MGEVTRGTDFSAERIREIFDSVQSLEIQYIQEPAEWMKEEARLYAESMPRPTTPDLRRHVDNAAQAARGWDDPDDPKMMLHTAIKTFYLLTWFEWAYEAARRRGEKIDHGQAVMVSFTPKFRNEASTV